MEEYSFRMKSPLLFFFLVLTFLLVVPFSLAAVEETFQHNDKYDLKRLCDNNGSFCSSSAVCNVTILYPNGNYLVNNQRMTNSGSVHNYSITEVQNNKLGFEKGIMSCTDGTYSGADTFDIAITGDGNPYRDFPNQFVFIIVGFVLAGIGFVSERLRLFKHAGGIILVVMGVLTLWPGYNFINWTTLVGKLIGFILIGLGFYTWIEDSFSRNKQEEHFEKENKEFPDDGRLHQ